MYFADRRGVLAEIRMLLGGGESGHPHLLGMLPDCCWMEVSLVTITCWGCYQIAAGWR